MNLKEALIQLNCTQETWEESAMELVFVEKQYLLKSAVTPPIFSKRAGKLMRIQEACDFLSDSIFKEPEELLINLPPIKKSHKSLLAFYRVYENLMSAFKLEMMQNLEPGMVGYWVGNLAKLENDKLLAINSLRENVNETHLDMVKLSQFVNSGAIIKELKTLKEVDNFKISNEETPNLLKDVVRSIKYVNFAKH